MWDVPPDEILLELDTHMTVDPTTGDVFMTSLGSQAIYRLSLGAGSQVTHQLIGDGEIFEPTGLSVGDDRTIYVATDGALKVFPPDPVDGWFEDPSSPFSGIATIGPFQIPRSRTNQDPVDPADPAFFNVLPTQHAVGVVDCIHLDADASGVVDFGDLTVVLANWLNDYTPGTGPGDADADGGVDFGDVTTILGNWLAPCP